MYFFACQAEYHEVKKYSGHVTNVKFTPGDQYVLTSGGVDSGILQWTLVDDLD